MRSRYLVLLFTARRSFRALIQASPRRRPNVIKGTLTGTASAPTCSGSQTGAQDDVKTDENAALFARLQHALRVQRASLRSNWITTYHGFVGVEIMISDTAAWDGSGGREGKPKAGQSA
jgi:hypothetical protein